MNNILDRAYTSSSLCYHAYNNCMDRLGSRPAPNGDGGVDPNLITPHLRPVQGLRCVGGGGMITMNIIRNRVHHGTSLCYPT